MPWKPLFAALAVVLSAPGAAIAETPAQPQAAAAPQENVQAFKDWALRCNEQSGCLLEHRVYIKEDPNAPVMVVAFQRDKGGSSTMGVIRVPLSVLLQKGLKVTVDGTALKDLPYHHCRPEGCLSLFNFDGDLRKRFQRGSKAKVGFQLIDGRELSIPLTLMGITAGLKALDKAAAGG